MKQITYFVQLVHIICAILLRAVDTLYVTYWYHFVDFVRICSLVPLDSD